MLPACSLPPQQSAAEAMDATAGQACSFQQAQADWQQLLLAMKQRRHAAQVSLQRLPRQALHQDGRCVHQNRSGSSGW